MKTKLNALSAWLDRHALPLGAALAAALSLLLALYNVGGGPLGNLNDIGGWRNRALYIALTAAVQLFVLLAAALLYHERFWRLAVRQLLLTVGLVILLMGVNHKSYLFVEQMLPFIRRMDAAGLSAMNDMRLNLSAPAVTALYLLTRGPIYDMYMLKLACMGAFLLMAVLAAHAADRRGWGLRGEALLLLCLILPQGFLAAGSAPQIDALGALLLVAVQRRQRLCQRGVVAVKLCPRRKKAVVEVRVCRVEAQHAPPVDGKFLHTSVNVQFHWILLSIKPSPAGEGSTAAPDEGRPCPAAPCRFYASVNFLAVGSKLPFVLTPV